MKRIRLIDWPYPDRPKLQQIRMTWHELHREGLGKSFRRLRRMEIVAVMVVFFVGFTLSMLVVTALLG